jgi:cytoplasmic polyadenylation element-binding protein
MNSKVIVLFLLQQERTMGNANGTSPLDNMRSLEHYLNDLMRGAGDTPDHLKGKE